MNVVLVPSRHERSLAVMIAIGVSALLFAASAIYNGFPLVFDDTAAYVELFWFNPVRTPYYNLFIGLLHLRLSLWPVVFAQALLMAHLLYLTLRVTLGSVDLQRYLILCLVLALCTSLPWFVGQIMPDLFTSVVVLGSFLLAFGADRMRRLETAYVFVLLAGAITLHLSHVPIALGLLLVVLVYKVAARRDELLRLAPVRLQAGAIALAAAGLVLANAVYYGNVTLSSGGATFLMAHSIVGGPGKQYLEESCPQKKYMLCAHLDKVTSNSDHFLWDEDGPFKRAGGLLNESLRAESSDIFWAALKKYPTWHLRLALRDFMQQLIMFSTGAELKSYLHSEWMERAIGTNFPGSIAGWRNSKQQQGELPRSTLALVGNVTAAVSFVLAISVMVVFWRQRNWTALGLMVMIAAALVGNAMIAGVISGPHDRYQSRVIWLVTFAAVAGGLSWLKQDLRRGTILVSDHRVRRGSQSPPS